MAQKKFDGEDVIISELNNDLYDVINKADRKEIARIRTDIQRISWGSTVVSVSVVTDIAEFIRGLK